MSRTQPQPHVACTSLGVNDLHEYTPGVILAKAQSGLEQAGTAAAILFGVMTLALSVYSTIMTRRQAAAQVRSTAAAARNEAAIVELQQNQSAALVKLAEYEAERRVEELEDRSRGTQARASADLRAELIAADRDSTKFWLRLWNAGQHAATDIGWAVSHDASILVKDPMNGSLILKQEEQYRARITSAEFPVPLEISWRDEAGKQVRPVRLPRPQRLP